MRSLALVLVMSLGASCGRAALINTIGSSTAGTCESAEMCGATGGGTDKLGVVALGIGAAVVVAVLVCFWRPDADPGRPP